MQKIFLILALVMAFCLTGYKSARADSPYQVSFIHPIQLIDPLVNIRGVRFNVIYGVNHDVSGLDIGLINQVNRHQKGLQVGLFNSSFKTSGVQLGIINKTNNLHGVQIGLINIHTEGMTEFFPIINYSF